MNPQKILVIRFSSLGDIILLTPLFREIKKIFPSSKLDFLTSSTFAELGENNPHIRCIIALDRQGKKAELNRVIRICKEENYDLILDAHRSLRSRLLLFKLFGLNAFFSKKIRRIDKRSFKRNLLLYTKINFLRLFPSQREAFCRLIQDWFAVSALDLSTELFPSSAHKTKIDTIQQQAKIDFSKSVVIGPGASFPGKCWPKENYLELANNLMEAGFQLLLLGGKNEVEPSWIEANAKKKPINLAGQLSFLESAELLGRCRLAISNDSAITHFSEAMNTPAISIFGPTVREFGFAPFMQQSRLLEIDLPCRPCSRNGKGKCKNKSDRECLRLITPEMVYQAAKEILEPTVAPPEFR